MALLDIFVTLCLLSKRLVDTSGMDQKPSIGGEQKSHCVQFSSFEFWLCSVWILIRGFCYRLYLPRKSVDLPQIKRMISNHARAIFPLILLKSSPSHTMSITSCRCLSCFSPPAPFTPLSLQSVSSVPARQGNWWPSSFSWKETHNWLFNNQNQNRGYFCDFNAKVLHEFWSQFWTHACWVQ